MTQRRAVKLADDPVGEAFRAFERWCAEHDPDGNLEVLERATAYSVWAGTNSIEKYLDAGRAALRAGRGREE